MKAHRLLSVIALSAIMMTSITACGGQAAAQSTDTKAEQIAAQPDETPAEQAAEQTETQPDEAAAKQAAEQTSGSVDSPALFKTVTRYDMNFSTGEWYKKEVQEYEYENGYPVLIKYHDFDSDMDWQYSYEYSFNGEMPVEMKQFDQDGILTRSAIYDENGRRDRDYYYSDSGNGTTERVYQYGNRDQYFTMVHHETLCKYPEEPDTPDEHAEEVDSVIVTRENDLLKKTVNDGLFANWADGQAKEWYRFMGSYTAEYDENGIAKELLSEYDDVSTNSKDRYDIMVEDGKVTEVVCRKYVTSDEPDGMAFTKYEFEYSDVEISQARYASMINYIIMEGGGTFYIFNWN